MCAIRRCNTGVVNQKTVLTTATTTASLTFPICFLHPRVLLLKVHLEVLEDLDFEVDGGGVVSQDAVVQGLHFWHKHLAGMHDHKEA